MKGIWLNTIVLAVACPSVVGRGAPHLLKGILEILNGQWPVPMPTSAKVQIFRVRTNHGVGSEIGRSRQNFAFWYPRDVVENDFTYFVRFENKIVLLS